MLVAFSLAVTLHHAGPGVSLNAPKAFTFERLPESLILDDFNGEGRPDAGTGGLTGGIPVIYIFLGNGDGSFLTPAKYKIGDVAAAIG